MQQKNAEQKVKKVQRAYVLALKLKAERLGAAAQQATVRSNRRAQDERDHKFIVEARHVRWKELAGKIQEREQEERDANGKAREAVAKRTVSAGAEQQAKEGVS